MTHDSQFVHDLCKEVLSQPCKELWAAVGWPGRRDQPTDHGPLLQFDITNVSTITAQRFDCVLPKSPSHGHLLQVDYTGFSTINAQRFGQKFVGKVANPHDILLWHKAPARKAKVNVCTCVYAMRTCVYAMRTCVCAMYTCLCAMRTCVYAMCT